MGQSPLLNRLESAIAPTAESMGYELVRVLLIGAGKPTLQILAENAEGKMGVEDCSRLSQAVSAVIDVENLMSGAYFLEVSSPGIDRPLTRLKDFEKYSGSEARIEMEEAVDGQKRFKGLLKGTEGGTVILATETGDVRLPFPAIDKAKLVLADDVMKATPKKQNKKDNG